MADAQKPKTENVTRAKQAIIAALAVVFAVVVYMQYFAGDENEIPDADQQLTSADSSQSTKESNGKAPELPQQRATTDNRGPIAATKSAEAWKPMPLEVALRYDPFATPRQFPQAVAQDRSSTGPMTKEEVEAKARATLESSTAEARNTLESLQQRGVSAVIAWQDRYYALVDDELIEVGDEIEGFKILRISADGVDVVKELPK